ncbi:hypothetical protein GCM10027406_05000 [Leifsonia lichenia]
MVGVAAAIAGFALAAAVLVAPGAEAATVPPILSLKYGVDQASQPAYQFGDNGTAKLSYATLSQGIAISTGAVNVSVVPPAGKPLAMGDYALVDTGQESGPSLPTVRLEANGSGAGFTGELDIRDLAWNSIGQIYRFDVVLHGLGELSMDEPQPGGVDLGARTLAFPATPIGFASAPAQQAEWLHNTTSAAVPIGAPTFAGVGAADFAASGGTCGSSLAAGATCSFKVGFSPKAPGPRTATLRVPVGGAVQSVALSGAAAQGTSSFTTSGNDPIDKGATHTYSNGPDIIAESIVNGGYAWTATSTNPSVFGQIQILPTGGGPSNNGPPLTLGVHTTGPWSGAVPTTQYGFRATVDSTGCTVMDGTIDVQSLITDALGLVEMAKIAYSERCDDLPNQNPMTGTLLWQYRSDTTPPAAPTGLTVGSGATPAVSWTASTSGDVGHTIVRVSPGSASTVGVLSGMAVADGTGTSATLPGLTPGQYTVAVYAVDASGNVSAPVTKTIAVGTAQTPYTVPGPPTNVAAVSRDGGGTVTFSPPVSDGNLPITQYQVRNTNTGASVLLPATARSATVTGLTNGFHYQYVVFAINAAGSGAAAYVTLSPVAGATPPPPPPPPVAKELLPDPGFESGPGGWKAFTSGVLTRVASPVRSGAGALEIAATSANVGLVGMTQNTVVGNSVAGKSYTASCWVRSTAGTLSLTAELLEYTQSFSSDVHLGKQTSAVPTGAWTHVSITGVAATSGERIIPQFYSTNETTSTGRIDYDDCSVTSTAP